MTDNNYKILQWSKEVIDEIIKDREKYTKEDLLKFLEKMKGNFHLILLSEAKNYDILNSKS